MSKPVEGGMSGISEQLSDLFKGTEPLGAEIARRTTTTIIPAASGFELLSLECAGEVCPQTDRRLGSHQGKLCRRVHDRPDRAGSHG